MNRSYISSISDQVNSVEVLVHLKLEQSNQQAVLKLKSNLTFGEFGSKIVETFRNKIVGSDVKSFEISKFYTKFNRSVLLRTGSVDFLEDGAEFEVYHADKQDQETTFWVNSGVGKNQPAVNQEKLTKSTKRLVPSLLDYNCGTPSKMPPNLSNQLSWHKETEKSEQAVGVSSTVSPSFPSTSNVPDQNEGERSHGGFFKRFSRKPSVEIQICADLDVARVENNNSLEVQVISTFSRKKPIKKQRYVDLDAPLVEDYHFSDLRAVESSVSDSPMDSYDPLEPTMNEQSVQEVPSYLEISSVPFCRRFLLPKPVSAVADAVDKPLDEDPVPVLDEVAAKEKVGELLISCRSERDPAKQSDFIRDTLNLLKNLGDPFALIKAGFDAKMEGKKMLYDAGFAASFPKFWAPAMLRWYSENRQDFDIDFKDQSFVGDPSGLSSEEVSMQALKLLCAFTEPSSFIGGIFCKAESEDMLNKVVAKSRHACAKIVDLRSNYFLAFCGKKICLQGGFVDAISFYCIVHSFFGLRFQNKNSKQLMYGVAVLLGLPLPTFCDFSEPLKQMIQGAFTIISSGFSEDGSPADNCREFKWTADALRNFTSGGVECLFMI